jgi:hypothetical protein
MIKETITSNISKYTITTTGLSDEIYIGDNTVMHVHIICDNDAEYTIMGRMFKNQDGSIATDLGQIDSNNFTSCNFSGLISNDFFTMVKSIAFDVANFGASSSIVVIVGTK